MAAISVTSTSPRHHHTKLQPITTRPGTPAIPGRSMSSQIAGSMVKTTLAIPSPSIVAARAYFLEHTTPIGPDTDAIQGRRSLFEEQVLPRRHSIVSSTGTLAAQLENFTFSFKSGRLQTVLEAEETGPKIKVEECDNFCIRESVESDEIVELQSRSDLMCGTPQAALRQVPFQYTHDHLRDWGYAYLGKSATADAFVNAVGLRRPSLAPAQEVRSECTNLVTIRARVTPRAKARKAFLIQRQFDIKELRSSIPAPKLGRDLSNGSPRQLRRSTRVRRQSVQPSAAETQRRKSLDIPIAEGMPRLNNGPVPIHVEYALHYLPVLAALMLSGHVRKGDNIDLPVPHPTAWHEVVTYIYTGSGILTSAVRENILYLAGHA